MKLNCEHIFLMTGAGLTTLAIGLLLGLWLADSKPQDPAEERSIAATVPETTIEATKETPVEETAPPAASKPEVAAIDKAALEDTVAGFSIPTDSHLSIVIHDLTNQERLLSYNSERLYPTASLYKLYLAYIAYEDVDNGRLSLEQPLVNHPAYHYKLNLGACLHLLITVSDSPCGETLLAHYDYPAIQARLEQLSLPHVNAAAFRASAEDMTRLLELIYGDNLSQSSRDSLLTSMHNQAYDVILQPAFRDYGQVYDKIGAWRNTADTGYHWIDVGIVELADREQALAITVLHENVPTEDLLTPS